MLTNNILEIKLRCISIVCILIFKFRQINSQVAGGPSMSMDGHNMPGNLPVPNNKNEGALVMLQTNQLKVCKLIILKR